ncbi:hypothetical protein PanWU01x14_022630 [Parasponia andersonii]|uniref:Uncharacterized protein n=1 Tax=Parasponia andersonii TaxID=3476 RepID=A0A2P5DXA3_PARAD|nr:hypothetical protein PanWU01x14_022630 [Parasponia andersonii]
MKVFKKTTKKEILLTCGLPYRNVVVKYVPHHEQLMRTLDFGITITHKKSWHYVFHQPKQWLTDDYICTYFYYLKKKRTYNMD